MPDGTLRVFFGGIRSTNPGETNNAMNTATAPASGAPWTLKPGKAAQATYAYATSYAGAGLAKNGTPISSWAGTPGLGFHYGVDPSASDGKIAQSGCCLDHPYIGVDSASGQALDRLYLKRDREPWRLRERHRGPGGPEGGRKLAPGSLTGKNFLQPIGRTPITGRLGAGGVFIAYGQGYPTLKTIAVWRVDTGKPQLVLKANGAKHVSIAAAPEGRLWVMWDVSGKIYATRTNHAATRVGPPSTLGPPGSKSVYEPRRRRVRLPARPHRQRRPGPLAPAGVAQAAGGGEARREDHRVHRRRRRRSGCRCQGKGRRKEPHDRCQRPRDPRKRPTRTGHGIGVEGRLHRRVRPLSKRVESSAFFARDGCTRCGSPGIFGKFGG